MENTEQQTIINLTKNEGNDYPTLIIRRDYSDGTSFIRTLLPNQWQQKEIDFLDGLNDLMESYKTK